MSVVAPLSPNWNSPDEGTDNTTITTVNTTTNNNNNNLNTESIQPPPLTTRSTSSDLITPSGGKVAPVYDSDGDVPHFVGSSDKDEVVASAPATIPTNIIDASNQHHQHQHRQDPPMSIAHFDLIDTLYKRRGGFGRNADINWLKRVFTLYGSILCYYDESEADKFDPSVPRGRLNLLREDTMTVMKTKRKLGAPTDYLVVINIFVIGGAKRKWEMCCANEEQQKKWYEAMRVFDGKPVNELHRHDSREKLPHLGSSRGKAKSRDDAFVPSPNTVHHSPITQTLTGNDVRKRQLGPTPPLPTLSPSKKENKFNLQMDLPFDEQIAISFIALNAAAFFMRGGTHILTYFFGLALANLSMFHMMRHLTLQRDPMGLVEERLQETQKITPPITPSAEATSNPNNVKRKGFRKRLPAGSTLNRAPPKSGTALEATIQQHGPLSLEAIRAYASSNEADYDDSTPQTYWNGTNGAIKLRVGPHYKKHKRKEPSAPGLYDLLFIDVVSSKSFLHNVSDGFEIPNIPGITDIDTGVPHVPPMIIINAWLPAEEQAIFQKATQGSCYVIVAYFVISEKTLEELKDLPNASPAVKLLSEWCRRGEDDFEFRSRFKIMGIMENIEKSGVPAFLQGYNGKPTLVSKSGKFTRYPNHIEMRVNAMMWTFVARKALYSLKDHFSKFKLNVGFTIEGRKDEELPEVLLGGCRVLHCEFDSVAMDG